MDAERDAAALEARSAERRRRGFVWARARARHTLPACMSTSGRIHGEFLRLLIFLSNTRKADDYFAALGNEAHKEEFCNRRGVFFHRNRCTIGMACAQALALRGAPPQLVATSLPLAACRPHTSSPMTIPGPTIGRVARVALS